MKKTSFLFVFLFLLGGILVSCQKKESHEIVIAVIPKVDNAIFDQVKQSAIAAGKELGVTVTWEAPTSNAGAKQKELIENLIRYKVDGILISCNDVELLKQPINDAIKAGIKVATFDSDCPKSDRIFYVGTDNKKAGKICAETMLGLYKKANKTPNQIILLSGGASAENMVERISGFRSVIKDNQITEILYSFEMVDYGKELLNYYLEKHSDINGVQMMWGVPALNGVDSIVALDRLIQKKGVCVFFDVSRPLLRYIIQHPNCATMKQDFSAMGRDGVINMVNAIKGNSYKILIQYDIKVIDHSNAAKELEKM